MSAHRVELDEPLSEGIARVARGRIDRALDERPMRLVRRTRRWSDASS